jgi:hypothetical protein
MRFLKKSAPGAFAVVGLLAVASVGAADDDNGAPPGMNAPQVTAIEADAKAALSTLERDRVDADALPDELRDRLNARAAFGMNADLSRLSIGNTTSSVYLVPARDHVCVAFTVAGGAATICPSTDEIAAGDASPSTVSLPGRDIAIYGAVPDGVESVSVQTGSSDSTRIPVSGNAYYTVIPAGTKLRTLSYVGPEGRSESRIVDPSLAFVEK